MMNLELTLRNIKETGIQVLEIEKVISFFINDNGDYFIKYLNEDSEVTELAYSKERVYKFFIY